MSAPKLIIDTNVFIGLEDEKEVAPEFAKFLQLSGQHGVRIFVHEAAIEDIKRDRDAQRKKVSLSKVNKFEMLSGIALPSRPALISRFGAISRPNDEVDVALLHALDIAAVDFIITQDQGIHGRARRCTPPLSGRVFNVSDAIEWLRTTFEPKEVRLPLIEEVPAHAIPLQDDIFESLREGYPDFDVWWREKCVRTHRLCWSVTIDGELAGLVVRKDETHAQAGTVHLGPKILKLCTFKVKPKFRGEKLGELLLKQVLWFAQKNAYDLVYVTTFDDQEVLISVIEYFGFQATGKNDRGEDIYEKSLSRQILKSSDLINLFEMDRENYPRFVSRAPASAYCVPIRGEYHNTLFPELIAREQEDLFLSSGQPDFSAAGRTPGNTIRKVYLCRAQIQKLAPGDLLLFYRSKSPGYLTSQCLTSVGIVESMRPAHSLEELIRMTAKRSAYTTAQLQKFEASSSRPVKVIDFLLVGHLSPVISLTDLKRDKVFGAHPPQSICSLPSNRLDPIRFRMNFGFDV